MLLRILLNECFVFVVGVLLLKQCCFPGLASLLGCAFDVKHHKRLYVCTVVIRLGSSRSKKECGLFDHPQTVELFKY